MSMQPFDIALSLPSNNKISLSCGMTCSTLTTMPLLAQPVQVAFSDTSPTVLWPFFVPWILDLQKIGLTTFFSSDFPQILILLITTMIANLSSPYALDTIFAITNPLGWPWKDSKT